MSRARLLLVDDEERVLRSLEAVFRVLYEVHLTTHPLEALQWIDQSHFDVVICDQRMPTMSGVNLLREIRRRAPSTVRLLLTGYADIPAIVASINEGEIHRYVHKPWEIVQLQRTVAHAVDLAAQPSALDGGRRSGSPQACLPVLVYDDDPRVSEQIKTVVGSRFVLTATDQLDTALAFIAQHPAPILITEARMGGVETLSVIRSLKTACPDLIVIVLTQQQDSGLLIRLVNDCQIFRFLHKPLSAQRVHDALHAAAALHGRQLAQHPRLTPRLPSESEVETTTPLTRRIAEYFRRRA
jgi:DNA-binding NtrC family response regulator